MADTERSVIVNIGILCLGIRVRDETVKQILQIAGLQTDNIRDRQQVAEGKETEERLHSSLS